MSRLSRHWKKAILTILFISVLYGDDLERYAPKEVPRDQSPPEQPIFPIPPPEKTIDRLVILDTRALILLGSSDDVSSDISEEVAGLKIKNLYVPGDIRDLERCLLPLFLHQPLTHKQIKEIKRTIVSYYHDHRMPFVRVITPAQDITDGALQLIVLLGRIDRICVSGNQHFDSEDILKSIRLRPGSYIDIDEILTNIAWLNRNPFRQGTALFQPGRKAGEVEMILDVQDRRQFRFYAGGENTGNNFTGNNRWYTGINWGNAFNIGHIASYQYTTSGDFRKFQAHTFNYTIFLPWRNAITLFAGYARVHPDITGFSSKGKAYQASLRYEIPLGKIFTPITQSLDVGFDYKSTNNNILFVDEFSEIRQTQTVNLTQFVFGYYFVWSSSFNQLFLDLEAYYSPFTFLDNQSKNDFNALRTGAKPIYIYGRIRLEDILTIFSWSMFFQARGEMSNENLLPSEQFSLGGYDTVRGYAERAVNTDNAFCFNYEFRTPMVRILKKPDNGIQFYGFIDWGYGWNHKREVGQPNHFQLLGVGPGVRFAIASNFSARLDWGFPILKVEDAAFRRRLHFGLLLTY
ncbi:MAG: hypothetical protein L0207_07135 [Chlamydiae bacterium]|nr:hypothetical protein [Chlamydiota bacterium]